MSYRSITLPNASSANALTVPATNIIGEDEYTKAVGFGSMTFDVLITFLEDAGAGEGITIEVSGSPDFAVVTVPELQTDAPQFGGLIDAAGFLEGQTIGIKNLQGFGRWRVKNEMAGAIEVSYAVQPRWSR